MRERSVSAIGQRSAADRDLDLRSIAKDRSHQPRIPPPAKNRDDPKRLLVWCVPTRYSWRAT